MRVLAASVANVAVQVPSAAAAAKRRSVAADRVDAARQEKLAGMRAMKVAAAEKHAAARQTRLDAWADARRDKAARREQVRDAAVADRDAQCARQRSTREAWIAELAAAEAAEQAARDAETLDDYLVRKAIQAEVLSDTSAAAKLSLFDLQSQQHLSAANPVGVASDLALDYASELEGTATRGKLCRVSATADLEMNGRLLNLSV